MRPEPIVLPEIETGFVARDYTDEQRTEARTREEERVSNENNEREARRIEIETEKNKEIVQKNINEMVNRNFRLSEDQIIAIVENKADLTRLENQVLKEYATSVDEEALKSPIEIEGHKIVSVADVDQWTNDGNEGSSTRKRVKQNIEDMKEIGLRQLLRLKFREFVKTLREQVKGKEDEVMEEYGVTVEQFSDSVKNRRKVENINSRKLAQKLTSLKIGELRIKLEEALSKNPGAKFVEDLVKSWLSDNGIFRSDFKNTDGLRVLTIEDEGPTQPVIVNGLDELVVKLVELVPRYKDVLFLPTEISEVESWKRNLAEQKAELDRIKREAREETERVRRDAEDRERDLQYRLTLLENEIGEKKLEARDLERRKIDAQKAKGELGRLIAACTQATEARDKFNGVGGFL